MKLMSHEEWRALLLARPPRTWKVATVREDGRLHVTPVWFDLDGDEVLFTTWHETAKARDLRRFACIDVGLWSDTNPLPSIHAQLTVI